MEVCDSWKGGVGPEEWPAIKAKLKQSKKKLNKFIDKLSENLT